jgi:flagellar motor protein MotB
MRSLMFFVALTLVGCASQPSGTQAKQPTTQAPAVSSSAAVQAADSVEARRLVAAHKLNLKVVDKDGKQLFCRSNLVTGSHLQRDETCYTADQLDHMQAQMQRDLDQIKSQSETEKRAAVGHLN